MTQYTVQRIRKNDKLYGSIHGSHDANETLCGFEIDHNWYVLTNDHDGEITCRKCNEAQD